MKEYAISKAIVEAICLGALEKGAKAYLTHPGIAKTGIINGFAPWIKRLANGLFYPFSHPVFKASMGIVSAFALDYPSGALLAPRGLLEISGYPKQKKRKLKGARIKQSWEALFERLSSQHEWKHSW